MAMINRNQLKELASKFNGADHLSSSYFLCLSGLFWASAVSVPLNSCTMGKTFAANWPTLLGYQFVNCISEQLKRLLTWKIGSRHCHYPCISSNCEWSFLIVHTGVGEGVWLYRQKPSRGLLHRENKQDFFSCTQKTGVWNMHQKS